MLTCIRQRFIKLDRININPRFVKNPPKPEKLITKTAAFLDGDKLEPILVDENYTLIDGYCSYLIASALQSKRYKVVMVKEGKRK